MKFNLSLINRSIFVLFIFSFTNCDKPEPIIEEECLTYGGDVIMPLVEGNYWINERIRYSRGEISDLESDTSKTLISQAITIQNDNVTYDVEVRSSDPSGYLNWLFWNGPDGMYFMGGFAGNDTLLTKVLLYKYPVETHDSWPVPRMVYDGSFYIKDTIQYTCVAKDESYETPLGNFQTIAYQHTSRIFDVLSREHYIEYYSPGIGRIERFIYTTIYDEFSYADRKIEDIKYKTTLIDYCLR